MVKTRSQAKKDGESSDDTEPMDIDDDDLTGLSSPSLPEVLMHSSSLGTDIQLPSFYSGSLGQAVDAAFSSPAQGGRRRLLLLFLYSDRSEAAGEFVREVVCHQEFRNMVAEVAELWGEDVSEERDREVVEMLIERELGQEVMELVGGFREENYPLLVVLGRGSDGIQAQRVFFAGAEIGEVVRVMMEIIEVEMEVVETDREELRVSRELKEEQEKAFEEAMMEDQRKLKVNKEEERQKLLKMKKDKEAKMKLQEEMKISQQQLVEEPGEEEDCVRVRMKMSGGQVERRFRKTDRVKNILDWVVCQGVGWGQFRLLFWPGIDIAKMDEDTKVGEVFSENRVMLFMEMTDLDIEEEVV